MPDNRYLDWSIHPNGDTFASTSRGTYFTTFEEADGQFGDEYQAWWAKNGSGVDESLGVFGTSDEAENACQHHYETWRAEWAA